MLRNTCIYILTFLYCMTLQAAANEAEIELVQDEVKQVESLILATQESLIKLNNLKKLIVNVKTLESACMKRPNDAALLFQLAQAGQAAYLAIQEANLEDFFQTSYITELKKLHAVASKKTIPPAR